MESAPGEWLALKEEAATKTGRRSALVTGDSNPNTETTRIQLSSRRGGGVDLTYDGVISALPTPFEDDGRLDLDSLRRVIDLFIAGAPDRVTISHSVCVPSLREGRWTHGPD
jgi:hypothetical protein